MIAVFRSVVGTVGGGEGLIVHPEDCSTIFIARRYKSRAFFSSKRKLMNRRFKSWLLAFVTSAVSAGIVTTLNLVLATPEQPQPVWLIELHAACAFVGAFAITRFIQGTPASLKGPTTRSSVAQGVVADTRIGTVNFVVPGNSAFFSPVRCLMILCFVLCLMVQFIQVGKLADDASGSPAGNSQQIRRLTT